MPKFRNVLNSVNTLKESHLFAYYNRKDINLKCCYVFHTPRDVYKHRTSFLPCRVHISRCLITVKVAR
jgi:hypothetical protein